LATLLAYSIDLAITFATRYPDMSPGVVAAGAVADFHATKHGLPLNFIAHATSSASFIKNLMQEAKKQNVPDEEMDKILRSGSYANTDIVKGKDPFVFY
jgi:hypothetical protein